MQPRTTPMPFQRVSTDFCGSPDHPRRAGTAERATWGTKTRRLDPPQPAPHPPQLVCGGNHGAGTHWCPSGGAPRWWWPGRWRPEPSPKVSGNTQYPCPPLWPGRKADGTGGCPPRLSPLPAELRKIKIKPQAQVLPVLNSRSQFAAFARHRGPLWWPACPQLGSHSVKCEHSVLGSNGCVLEVHASRASSSPVRAGRGMSVVTSSSSHKRNTAAPWPGAGVDSREVMGLGRGVSS
jgi:hypothetical protein